MTVTAATLFLMGGTGTIENGGTKLNDYTQTQYGVRYALSKRTTAYFSAGTSKDKAATSTAFAKNTFSAIGVAHSF